MCRSTSARSTPRRRRPTASDWKPCLARTRPEYAEAFQYASIARQLLNYHAALARTTEDRVARGLGLRDAMMADNLAYIVERERARGRVLAFAHNSHLQRGRARWQLGPLLNVWWPPGMLPTLAWRSGSVRSRVT